MANNNPRLQVTSAFAFWARQCWRQLALSLWAPVQKLSWFAWWCLLSSCSATIVLLPAPAAAPPRSIGLLPVINATTLPQLRGPVPPWLQSTLQSGTWWAPEQQARQVTAYLRQTMANQLRAKGYQVRYISAPATTVSATCLGWKWHVDALLLLQIHQWDSHDLERERCLHLRASCYIIETRHGLSWWAAALVDHDVYRPAGPDALDYRTYLRQFIHRLLRTLPPVQNP